MVLVFCPAMDPARRERIARQHVETDRLLGADAVPLGLGDEEPAEAAPAPEVSAEAEPQSTEPAPDAPAPTPEAAPNLLAAAAADAAAGGFSPLDRDTKVRLLEVLDRDEVRGCTKCELCHGRTNTVFGEGDPDADLLFIGEGPGQNEDEQGRPFVGRAGDLLNKMIVAMGLEREQVFIANIVKCRPPNNRAPTPAEVDACWGYLRRQIETIQPRVIVTLGGPSTKMILQTKEGITRLRGQWASFEDLLPAGPSIPVMPTFHPAYLLRSYTVENRKKVWSDLQAVMERLASKS